MDRLTARMPSSVPDWMPLLAAAIVQQALMDAADRTLPASVRGEARRFLSGSDTYRLWEQVAERGAC